MKNNRFYKKTGGKRKAVKTGCLILCVILAAGSPMQVSAGQYKNQEKEENVYANLDANGVVQGIYVVNSYIMEETGKIVDYGKYTATRNLTSDSEITQENEAISVSAEKGKFSYQGNLESREMPWAIKITYYLDGQEVKPEKLAGATGKLEIYMQIGANEAVDSSFFDQYLLQATVTLSTERCQNIEAQEATIANVGNEKQILYNLMAGTTKDITITANVADFEMDAITFKGVPMAFAIDLDQMDTGILTKKTDEITEATTKLDDGAQSLSEGVDTMQEGMDQYAEGIDQVYEGAGTLFDGVSAIQPGIVQYTEGVDQMTGGIATLAEKTASLPALMGELTSAISQLNAGSASLAKEENWTQIQTGLETIETGLVQMKAGLAAMNDQALTPMLTAMGEEGALRVGMTNLESGLSGACNYVTALESVSSEYAEEVTLLSDIMTGIQSQSQEDTGVNIQSEEIVTHDPVIDSQTETTEGEYVEDYFESSTENGVDEEGNPVTIITNTIYQTRTNTVTTTNEITTNTTRNVVTTQEAEQTDYSGSQDLTALYQRMAANFGTMQVLIYGDKMEGSTTSGLKNLLGSCESGAAALDAAIFTEDTSIQKVLYGIQTQLGGKEGLLANMDTMITGLQTLENVLYGSTGQSIKSSAVSLQQGLSTLNAKTVSLPSSLQELTNGVSDLQLGACTLSSKNQTLLAGTDELYEGTEKLSQGTAELTEKTTELSDGVNTLSDGVTNLKEGTSEFLEKTDGLEDQIRDGLEEELKKYTGEDYEPVSFVSSENTNVSAIQFVMKTEAIELEEVIVVEEEVTAPTLLDKLKGLFQ